MHCNPYFFIKEILMLEEIEVLEDHESNFKKICGIIIMLSSKQIYVTKSCINDPIQ